MRTLTVGEIAKAVSGTIIIKGELPKGNSLDARSADPRHTSWAEKDIDENQIPIDSISTDSRKVGETTLFVPLVGERVDAHQFIGSVLEQGCLCTLTSQQPLEERGCYIQVEDTMKALQSLAAFVRAGYERPLVGVTGSVGKTTTKEMVAACLEADGKKVLKTEGNMNSQVGLPLMMFRLETDTELAVIEMGMSEKGEMKRLSTIARPTMAVMTNIGVSHIGNLGSQQNIRKEKLCIINDFPDNGVLFVNGDDALLGEIVELKQMAEGKEASSGVGELETLLYPETIEKLRSVGLRTYGLGEHCTYRALDVTTKADGASFLFHSPKKEIKVTLQVPGSHNILNAVAALAIAEELGIDLERAAQKLSMYQPLAMRGGFISRNGFTIIDDTYNASPDSMKSGIEVLLQSNAAGRRFAVLADVLELGERSRDCHFEVGQYIAGKCIEGHQVDVLVTVGEQAKYIAEGAGQGQFVPQTIKSFEDRMQVLAYLKEEVREGDLLLLKGSRGMHMDEIVKEL